jgi:integrating conjugative element protein (TIGR03765 family)
MRLPTGLHAVAALLLAGSSAASFAGVTTIHEGGPTVPIDGLLAALVPPRAATAAHPAAPPADTALPLSLPVRSASMRPGRIETARRLAPAAALGAPMFIVGDDPLSRRWLTANRERLQRAGASGLVVDVATLGRFQALRALVPGLPLAPASLDAVAPQSGPDGLSVYPLYIAPDGSAGRQVK